MLTNKNRIKAFLAVCIPLALAKFWQETLYMMSYFLEKDFLVPAAKILQTAAYQPLGVAVGYVATAILVDRVGIKRILSTGLIFMSVFIFMMTQTTNWEMLYFYRFCIGLLIGLIYNCSFGALPIIFESHELPKKTSIIYMFAFSSALLAPQWFTYTEAFFSWRVLLLIVTALTTLSGLAVGYYFPHKTNQTDTKTYFKQCWELVTNRTFILMTIVSTLCMGGFFGFVNIFIKNLHELNLSATTSKFIIADMQSFGRLILFAVTTWSGYKLTQQNIPRYLKYCMIGMIVATLGLLYFLTFRGSLFGNAALLSNLIPQASEGKHVILLLIPAISGAWMFWLYAGIVGVAQPANKSKCLAIAGKERGGAAQAVLGFLQAAGEVFFVKMIGWSWPAGTTYFLLFVLVAAFIALRGLKKI